MKPCWPLTGRPEPTEALLQESADSDSLRAQIKGSSQRSYDEKKRRPTYTADCKTLRQRATAFSLSLAGGLISKAWPPLISRRPGTFVLGPAKRRGRGRISVGSAGRCSGWHGPAWGNDAGPRNILSLRCQPQFASPMVFSFTTSIICASSKSV